MSRFTNPVFDAAEQYANSGLSIIPIKPDGSKQPPVAWKEYQSHIAGPEERSQWFANGANYGIAVICGQVSGNVEALDFDDIHAFEEWGQVVKDLYPDLARQLVVSQTPGPGVQVLYRCETPPPGNQVLARDINGQVKIETRAEGGYVIAPPSGPECHPNRKPYLLRRGSFTSLPVVKDDERALLLGLAKQMDEAPPKPERPPPAPVVLSPQPSGGRPGDDYNERGDHHALLTRHGWAYEGCHGGEEYWRRPAKDKGHSAEWSVEKQLFHVFSSNAAPFEQGRGYGLFHCFALLEHGGDFSAAAKALAAQGYGDNEKASCRALLNETPPEEDAPPGDTEKPRFPLLTFRQLLALPPPRVQVAGLFDEESFIEVFGQTNHGKSLFVLDMALSIAKGSGEWFGRRILKPGPVVWVNADGGRGMVRRALAWKEANGAELQFPFLTLMGSLRLNRPEEVAAFLEQIRALDPRPALIVFDTLSRCIPGADENLQGEMTKVTESCHRLKIGTGGTVCLVHHTDKLGTHDRGSSVVKNETDTQIRVTMDAQTRIACVHSEKSRDGTPFPDFYFSLQPVGQSVVIVQAGPIGEAKERRDREQTAWLRNKLLFILASTPGGATLDAINEECGFEPEDRRAYRILRDLITDKKVIAGDDPAAHGGVGRTPKRYWLVGSPGLEVN